MSWDFDRYSNNCEKRKLSVVLVEMKATEVFTAVLSREYRAQLLDQKSVFEAAVDRGGVLANGEVTAAGAEVRLTFGPLSMSRGHSLSVPSQLRSPNHLMIMQHVADQLFILMMSNCKPAHAAVAPP